jgi:hypothetical protein
VSGELRRERRDRYIWARGRFVQSIAQLQGNPAAMSRRVNDISLHADDVSSYVMHARLNLGMDNASARETCSAEKARKCGSGDKVYLEGKLMEINFEIDRWG